MATSSAVPEALLRYARLSGPLEAELGRRAQRTDQAVLRFLATRPELGGVTPNPGPDVAVHARDMAELAAWVGRVGQAFLLADLGRFAFLRLLDPSGPVTLDDLALDGAGWPTSAEAAEAGRALAREVADNAGAGADRLEAWSDRIARHADDPAFTAAFFTALGRDGTLALPQRVEDRYPTDDRWGRPAWGLDVLGPFSRALATAMATRNDARLPEAYRMPHGLVTAIVEYDPGYDFDVPQAHHQALLFSTGTFPTDVLLRLGQLAVVPSLVREQRAGPFHLTPWGPGADPVAIVLAAIARNPAAASAFVARAEPYGARTNLELLLERWTELDGDAGRAGAEVLRLALTDATHPRRAEHLFDEAMRTVERLDGIRNPFAAEVLAGAAAVHIRHLQDVASTEGGGPSAHADLVTARVFLSHLFADASGDAPTKVLFTAAAGAVYDTVNGIDTGTGLGSEAWEIGSLLGLFVVADSRAAIEDTEDRIAHRQALLDGLRQTTDLALTFTRGRWIPFATAGRDQLLDQFRTDGERDVTLADADAFEAELRFELSAVIAVRLAHNGQLTVPPGVRLAPMADLDDRERTAFRRWVDSTIVRDAIGTIRIEAGQRMDEVEDALDGDG